MLRCDVWRPSLVIRPFELDRPDDEPGHVAAVGVLAANADLVNTGEVVDVVLLDNRPWEVLERAFEDVFREFFAGDRLRRADGRERTAAIAPEAKMDADSRLTLLKSRENAVARS